MDINSSDRITHRGDVPSERELLAFGAEDTAYVKLTEEDGQTFYAIYQGDGTQIGAAPTRETAFAAIRQHEMEPLSVH